MSINKQVKSLFNATTIPIYVEGIDIIVKPDEIVYTATDGSREISFVIRKKIVRVLTFKS